MDAATHPSRSNVARVPDCEHRGQIIAMRPCETCNNRTVQIKVYACDSRSTGVTLADCCACPIPRMCWRGPYRIEARPGMIRCDLHDDDYPANGLQCERCKAGFPVDLAEHRKSEFTED